MSVKKRVKKKKVIRKPLKKRTAKRPSKLRRPVKAKAGAKAMKKAKGARKKSEGRVVGIITHYFPHVMAAVIKLKAGLAVGDVIKVKGHTTDFTQTISSMQIDHVPVNQAKKGQEIGLLADSRVRQHDIVYKV